MPTLIEDLSEGFKLALRDGEKIELTRVFHVTQLVGETAVLRLASALDVPGLPLPQEFITVRGRQVYPRNYDVQPFADDEATITVQYSEIDLSITGGGNDGRCIVSGGTSLRQVETEFDVDNLTIPFDQREPIYVEYDASEDGEPGDNAIEQGGRVLAFLPDSSVTFTRFERSYPGGRSRDYAGKRNASAYEGCAPGTLLMWSVTFQQIRSNLYQVSYTMVYDPYGKWNQILRYIDPLTGKPPKLSQAQVEGENGIKEITTQEDISFQSLNLVIA